ncbi:MAG: VirB3 family type IV secretion system protein [Myxococcota bacterium]
MQDSLFRARVHRSLTQPLLFAGVPRQLALVNGTTTVALALGAQSLLAIPVGLGFHALLAMLTRHDPQFLQVLMRNLKRGNLLQV